jgi:small subunit ribosomal protein S13
MPRIAGVDVPSKKKVHIALRYIYGVGATVAGVIINEAGIDPATKAGDLSEGQIARIREIIESKFRVEGDLRRQVQGNIKLQKDLGTWRGLRHIRRLPLKGRTHSNARTVKGKKRMAIAGKKAPPKG